MILITSAKYSSADFTLEFGKIPPSFLPLGNKRLYEYQIKLFKDLSQKIFLSLPKDFKLSKFDENKLRELGGGGGAYICSTRFIPWRIYCLLLECKLCF